MCYSPSQLNQSQILSLQQKITNSGRVNHGRGVVQHCEKERNAIQTKTGGLGKKVARAKLKPSENPCHTSILTEYNKQQNNRSKPIAHSFC